MRIKNYSAIWADSKGLTGRVIFPSCDAIMDAKKTFNEENRPRLPGEQKTLLGVFELGPDLEVIRTEYQSPYRIR